MQESTNSILESFTGSKNSFIFNYSDSDSELIILKRKKPQTKNLKPPFYIFDLTKKSYVSSLRPTKQENVFKFDVRLKNDVYKFYTLEIQDSKIQIHSA